MPKQQGRKVGAAHQAARGQADKQILIDDGVYMSLGVLRADEREAVQEVLHSPARVRRLLRGAPFIGSERKYRVADVTPQLRVIFRETPRQIRLLELIGKRAFDSLDVPVSPAQRPDARPKSVRNGVEQ